VGCIKDGSCVGNPAPPCDEKWYVDDPANASRVTTYSNTATFLDLFGPSNWATTTKLGGGYWTVANGFGGTSAACPYAAGGAACLQRAAEVLQGKYLTPAQVRSTLTSNGSLLSDPKTTISKPLIDLSAAIASLQGSGYTRYVNATGYCGVKTPCYATLQQSIDLSGPGETIKIAWGTLGEDIVLNNGNALKLKGGYNSDYTAQTSETVLNSMCIQNGSAEIDKLTLAASSPPPPPGSVPDTGQTKCYSDTGEIPCPQRGQDFLGQDGNYSINPLNYTKLDRGGNPLSPSATYWVMVKDNVTGLIWEVKTDDGSIHDRDDVYSWNNARDVFIASLNGSRFGEVTDWRLPTIKELAYIMNYGRYDPAIDTQYFPNIVSSDYWSSTTTTDDRFSAWHIEFKHGLDKNSHKSSTYYVRAVRGEQSNNRFVDNKNGTVTDTNTRLIWQTGRRPLNTAETLALGDAGNIGGFPTSRSFAQSLITTPSTPALTRTIFWIPSMALRLTGRPRPLAPAAVAHGKSRSAAVATTLPRRAGLNIMCVPCVVGSDRELDHWVICSVILPAFLSIRNAAFIRANLWVQGWFLIQAKAALNQ